MTFQATLALIALPVAGLFTLYALVAALVCRPRSIGPVVLASVGAGLAALWVVRAYQLGVEADATGGRGSILEELWWLVAAVVFAGASLLLASSARHRRLPELISSLSR